MTGLLLEGLLLGLSTGTFCLVSCAPMLVPFLLADGRPDMKSNFRLLVEFLLGRLTAYLLFGFIIGILGERFAAKIPAGTISAAMLLSGLLVIAYVLSRHLKELGLCRLFPEKFFSKPLPFLLGFLVGVNICPPFVAGSVKVFEMASPLKGMGYFFAFFVGTSFYLLPLLAASPFSKIKRLQSIGVLACLLAGGWFVFQGALGLYLR